MDRKEIEILISDFDSIAGKVKTALEGTMLCVAEGRIPRNIQLTELNEQLDKLKEEYLFIKSRAEEVTGTTFAEDLDIPINEFKTIIENSEVRKFKEKLLLAEKTLDTFIRIKSAIDGYAKALQPMQEKVSDVIISHNKGTMDDKQFIDASKLPAVFVEAVSIENIDGDKGIDLLDLIGEHFPKRVMAGVAAGKYYISNDLQNVEANLDKVDANRTENVVEEEIAITSQMIDERNVQELDVKDICERIDSEIAAVEEPVISTESEEILFSCNRPKSCAANASSFKGEIKGFPNAIGNVLPLFTSLGALTETQIYRYGICMDCYTSEATEPREMLSNIIERLMNKGWLAAYEIDEDGTKAYCLSKYVCGCLAKSSIKGLQKFWGISFGKLEFYGEEKISKSMLHKFIEANERMLIYLEGVRKLLDIETYRRIISSIKWENEHFAVRIIDEGNEITSVMMNSLDEKAKCDDEMVLYVVKANETEAQVKRCNNNTYLFINGKMCNRGKSQIFNEEKSTDEYEKVEHTLEKRAQSIKPSDESLQRTTDGGADGMLESLEDEMEALSDVHSSMSDHELCDYIRIMLKQYYDTEEERLTAVSNAVLLAKASSLEEGWEESKRLYNQLLYATAIPLDEFQHTSITIPEVFQDNSPEALKLCAQMYSMLVPGSSYGNVRDYTLKSMNETSLRDYEQQFPNCSSYKELFSKLTGIGAIAPSGYTTSIIARLGDDAENQKYIYSLSRQAKDLQTLPNIKTRMKTLPAMYNSCFGKSSELYECMNIVAENRVLDRDFVEAILEEYCENAAGEFKISLEKIERKLDAEWAAANPGNPFTLDFDARGQAIRRFFERLNLMKLWYEHTDNSTEKGTDLSKLKTMRDDIIELCNKALTGFNAIDLEYSNAIYWMIKYIKDYISGEFDAKVIYKSVLYTGRLPLDEKSHMPCMDPTLAGITYCEPWRSVIAHIETGVLPIEEVIDAINDKDSLMFDNLNQLSLIGKCIKDEEDKCQVAENREKDALRAADVRTKKFKERLELAYTYDQISEVEKETLAGIMERQQIRFYGIRDYGCWRQFLDGLERQIIEIAIDRKNCLRKKIDSRIYDNPNSVILKEALVLLERDTNLAVAEEYLNRFDAGETELSIDMESFVKPRNEFTTFLSEEVYDYILNAAKRKTQKPMKEWGWDFVSGKLPADWTNRLKEDSQKIIYNWPAGRVRTTSENAIKNACLSIEILFKGLGFAVKDVTFQKGTREETYTMELGQTPRSLADYPHPIAAFGTQIKPKMKVMVLYGNHTPGQIVEAVSRADNKGFSVVLLDRPLEKVARRQVGELSHQKSGQNPFLLIDWVLLLHLALHDNTKRLPLLLTCALPYTTYQPFVWDGGSTADEMFCGRTKELNDIMNPSGACVVYGGRQLGKTALLERAESRCHRPDNKEYAVFCSIIKKRTEREVAALIVEKINIKTNLGLKSCSTLKEVCSQIESFINNGQIVAFFLFLDECDDFLGAISDNAYQQLQPMIDLKRASRNSFKFVLAGLHNVCRAKNSTERNGVFGQLGQPLCVKPLAPTDALQLLVKPLNYLGFQINLNPHLNTILTRTNYYPGILQFFGYKLLETLNGQYSKYYSAANGNPPFSLKEEQLGAVLSSADLNNSIKEKFRWSLELDQRYFMICRCITMLYHFDAEDQNSNWKGFSVEQIREMADIYGVYCLKGASSSDYINLLDEMVDMGILSKLEGDTYRLRRNSFVDIIGSDMDALERDIIENNVEVAL